MPLTRRKVSSFHFLTSKVEYPTLPIISALENWRSPAPTSLCSCYCTEISVTPDHNPSMCLEQYYDGNWAWRRCLAPRFKAMNFKMTFSSRSCTGLKRNSCLFFFAPGHMELKQFELWTIISPPPPGDSVPTPPHVVGSLLQPPRAYLQSWSSANGSTVNLQGALQRAATLIERFQS